MSDMIWCANLAPDPKSGVISPGYKIFADKIISACQRVLRRADNDGHRAVAHIGLGKSYFATGDLQKAREHFARAIETGKAPDRVKEWQEYTITELKKSIGSSDEPAFDSRPSDSSPTAQVAASTQRKPSFDCRTAREPAEVSICSTETLSALDRELAESYRAALRKNPEDTERIRHEQREWVNGRNRCNIDVKCLTKVMRHRIAELSQDGAIGGVTTPLDKIIYVYRAIERRQLLGSNDPAVPSNSALARTYFSSDFLTLWAQNTKCWSEEGAEAPAQMWISGQDTELRDVSINLIRATDALQVVQAVFTNFGERQE